MADLTGLAIGTTQALARARAGQREGTAERLERERQARLDAEQRQAQAEAMLLARQRLAQSAREQASTEAQRAVQNMLARRRQQLDESEAGFGFSLGAPNPDGTPAMVQFGRLGPSARERELTARQDFERAEAERQRAFLAQENARNRGGALDVALARASGTTSAGGPQGRILPASRAEELANIESVVGLARDARQGLQAAQQQGINITGPIVGNQLVRSVTEALGGAPDEAIATRATLANLATELQRLRSGAAITAQEFTRLDPFLPRATDTEAVASVKLAGLIRELTGLRTARMQALGAAGYNVSGFDGAAAPRAAAPAAAAPPPADDADAWAADFLARRRQGATP